jgi:hypothetical protein
MWRAVERLEAAGTSNRCKKTDLLLMICPDVCWGRFRPCGENEANKYLHDIMS